MVETIHDRNCLSRITIYSGADKFPMESTVTELKADGYINGVMTFDQYVDFAREGEVTAEEYAKRGKSIEDVVNGCRVGGELRRFKFSKEREE
jgi:hypothetical protein